MVTSNKIIFIILTFSLLVPMFATTAIGDESFTISEVQGDSLFREAGDYMWRRPSGGDVMYAGDRLRVRNGELTLILPQSTMTVINEGEVQIPVELIDGLPEPWDNDIEMYIGSYTFQMVEQKEGRELKLVTPCGEIEASDDARFNLEVTVKGSTITVLAGKVFIKHRRQNPEDEVIVEAGNIAQIAPDSISLKDAGAVAMK